MRALGFCVSVEHARFMARVFREAGIPAVGGLGRQPRRRADRRAARTSQPARQRRVLGRPLQRRRRHPRGRHAAAPASHRQPDAVPPAARPRPAPTPGQADLHRPGLRRPAPSGVPVRPTIPRAAWRKPQGPRAQIARAFRFCRRAATWSSTAWPRTSCLQNIRAAVPSRWRAKVEELRLLARGDETITLAQFLEETGLELDDVYGGRSDLVGPAGRRRAATPPTRAERRLAATACATAPAHRRLRPDRRLQATARGRSAAEIWRPSPLESGASSACWWPLLRTRRSTSPPAWKTGANCCGRIRRFASSCSASSTCSPSGVSHVQHGLRRILTCRWRPRALLAPRDPRGVRHRRPCQGGAVADGRLLGPRRQGGPPRVHAGQDQRAVLADDALPRLRDQPRADPLGEPVETRADSETGRRYQHHEALGSAVMLFARLRADDRAFWFLGPATYVAHECELPMAITWRLAHPLPGDLFAQFAAAVA